MATDPRDSDTAGVASAVGTLFAPRQRLLAAAVAATVLVVGYIARLEESMAARLEEALAPLLQQVAEQRGPQRRKALEHSGEIAVALPDPLEVAAGPRWAR